MSMSKKVQKNIWNISLSGIYILQKNFRKKFIILLLLPTYRSIFLKTKKKIVAVDWKTLFDAITFESVRKYTFSSVWVK